MIHLKVKRKKNRTRYDLIIISICLIDFLFSTAVGASMDKCV